MALLICTNVSEAQLYEECLKGRAEEPYAFLIMLGRAVHEKIVPVNSLNSQKVNVHVVKYGSELSDQQMNKKKSISPSAVEDNVV